MVGKRFTVGTAELRGLTFLSTGQRSEWWLPGGEWEVVEECELIRDRDSAEKVPALAVRMVPTVPAAPDMGTWYVGRTAVRF